MLVVDDGWAAGPGWPERQRAMAEAVDEAERDKPAGHPADHRAARPTAARSPPAA